MATCRHILRCFYLIERRKRIPIRLQRESQPWMSRCNLSPKSPPPKFWVGKFFLTFPDFSYEKRFRLLNKGLNTRLGCFSMVKLSLSGCSQPTFLEQTPGNSWFFGFYENTQRVTTLKFFPIDP